MQIINLAPSALKPYAKNAKKHPQEQIERVAESIKQFGFVQPVVIDKNNVIVIGHCRVMAAKRLGMREVPCVLVDTLTPEQVNALRLADNKTNESAWDIELMSDSLLEVGDIDMAAFGFDIGMEQEAVEDDYDIDIPEEPRSKIGDIYQLGRHRLMCGDSTDKATVEMLMDGNKADMVFTDPPYGMKKEADGVLNDNLNYDDLLEFNKKWIPLTFENTKENGSWYCWGIDEPLMDIYSHILRPMAKENKITFRNLITWDKGDAGAGGVSFMGKEGLRSYPVSDEKCLFVMCGVQGFNNNADHYDETFEPIRAYMEQEAKKVDLKASQLKEICGVGMYSHWFTKSQFGIIPQEHYEKLQRHFDGIAFTLAYNDLKSLFDDEKHQEAIMAKRAYFDNTHDKMKTVWEFGRTRGEERELCGGHATPKPIALCSRAIKSSSREGEIVLDLFGGSGSTLIACEQLGRTCYMMELDPRYVDVIIDRWEKFTGQKAERLEVE